MDPRNDSPALEVLTYYVTPVPGKRVQLTTDRRPYRVHGVAVYDAQGVAVAPDGEAMQAAGGVSVVLSLLEAATMVRRLDGVPVSALCGLNVAAQRAAAGLSKVGLPRGGLPLDGGAVLDLGASYVFAPANAPQGFKALAVSLSVEPV